ncbi:MAG: threonine synthase [Hyphomicrobiaceae bacterium]|nr:MAG: threonine synthase [Hyphomicrobiaceae bacterium]
MRYISTRGRAIALGFEDVLMTGLARDGGLYVPEHYPELNGKEIAGFAGRPYQEVAVDIMSRFMGGAVPLQELVEIVRRAYERFEHKLVAPLQSIGADEFVLELFRGPTLAFKDIAMQVLAGLMDRTLRKRKSRATIVGATSGDTGAAAIEAFRGMSAVDVFILYPEGRISEVQRRQMTTPTEANVHAIAIKGTFDDCQSMLKAMFNDLELRDRLQLSGVNSINWARLMVQIVYYFTGAVAAGAPDRRVTFSVPTGNFGDIFAGYVALRMGLPIRRLIIATNVNDILVRTLETGRYEPRDVVATSSPSMDIQLASNFERLLFELAGRKAGRVRELMEDLARKGSFTLNEAELKAFRARFSAVKVDETEMARVMAETRAQSRYVADPHTAVGIAAARRVPREKGVPVVTLATAHPSKFAEAVRAAIGGDPLEPTIITRQRHLPERRTVLPNDLRQVVDYITEHARAGASR